MLDKEDREMFREDKKDLHEAEKDAAAFAKGVKEGLVDDGVLSHHEGREALHELKHEMREEVKAENKAEKEFLKATE